MSALNNKLFWIDTAERAIKTFAQTLVALLGAGAVDILNVNWGDMTAVSLGAAVVSVLTSIASAGSGNSASLVVDAKIKR